LTFEHKKRNNLPNIVQYNYNIFKKVPDLQLLLYFWFLLHCNIPYLKKNMAVFFTGKKMLYAGGG